MTGPEVQQRVLQNEELARKTGYVTAHTEAMDYVESLYKAGEITQVVARMWIVWSKEKIQAVRG